ncbi:PASTA domain-containing protein [Streptomyces tagetis]|uniref:PASTA domain-containing protein n=1 Tax=Streptomyces tagetis TaxID=2820809 RepID=A0A940XKZ4_9ACTN|nr:PASTA domain-containing protein [Streptomyces sp. RG38]MBQ0825713.1 PASTA domain-containing protein [Streptomyces sp. RG38]
MSQTAAQRLLRNDPRTTEAASSEPDLLPLRVAEALLAVLGSREKVLAFYRSGAGHAVLTGEALILLGGRGPQRVPRPLTIVKPAHGARRRVDVSVEGRSVGLWGSRVDASGELLERAGKPAPDALAEDPRTAAVAGGEAITLPAEHRRLLLDVLGPDEVVRSVYHSGWGYAVLTGEGLVLLRNLVTPTAARAPLPLRIVRRAHGLLATVDVLVDGRTYKLHGSKLDPRGEALESVGEVVVPGPAAPRPGVRRPEAAWIRRHPVLTSAAVVGVLVAGVNAGRGGEPAVRAASPGPTAEASVVVPDFEGSGLRAAATRAGLSPWRAVSVADASSAHRPVEATATGWQVCFQSPSREERVRPSGVTLTLYAVPEREECPARLRGPRLVVMPDLVGERYRHVARALDDLGLHRTDLFHTYTGKPLGDSGREPADWTVCRQTPQPDTRVEAGAQIDLWLIGPGDPCEKPSPQPDPTPDPTPKPKPKSKPRPTPGAQSDAKPVPRPQPSYGGGGGSGGSGTGGSSGTGGTTGGGPAGVGFGQACAPVGATATTADGRPAKCFMGKDGRARWGYNSG